MAGEIQIPFPVAFNPFKHHRNYILNFLEKASPSELKNLTDAVCDNYIDVYTGSQTPETICFAIIDYLKTGQIYSEENFKQWIKMTNGYRQIKLEDQSGWIVREGTEAERYIHIHPAKTGLFSIRYKGSTLKTIYRLKIENTAWQNPSTLEMVNRARIEIGLSPIKKLEPGKGILKCREVFLKHLFE